MLYLTFSIANFSFFLKTTIFLHTKFFPFFRQKSPTHTVNCTSKSQNILHFSAHLSRQTEATQPYL